MFELSFTARNVLLGASLLGLAGGVLGSFAVMRRQSLLGDALAHAALPGVCSAYLLTHSKNPVVLLVGAMVAGLVGALLMSATVRWSRIKQDTAIGIVLSVFFGAGIVMLTHIQKLPYGNQSGLDKYLFGQAATLGVRDVRLMALLCGIVLLTTLLLFKEFKLLCFDREFAASQGLPVRRLDVLLTFLLVVVVVIGLQTVGVVLIVATLITPAAAARQWTERFGVMVLLAGLFGSGCGAVGALLSASIARLPTGPVIVLCASVILVVSLLAAPRRGLAWALIEERGVARRIRGENLLKDLYVWGEREGGNWYAPVKFPALMGLRGQTGLQLSRAARRLLRRGSLTRSAEGLRLTDRGLVEAEAIVRKHRLWELYLTRRLELASDHVHRDADTMEHALDDETVEALERLLGHPTGGSSRPRDSRQEDGVSATIVILLVGACVASSCALLGGFLVLRRMALLGDAISHAVLPGIVIAFLLAGSRAPVPMLLGAGALGVITVALVELFQRSGRLKEDASIGVVFTALFSIGVILVSRLASQVDLDLDCVLYGEIAYAPLDVLYLGTTALGPKALWVNGAVLLLNLVFVMLFFKELKLTTFDPELATALGFSPVLMHYLLMSAVSITVVGAFESVGAILVLAMLVVPPAAAYLLTDRLDRMLLLGAGLGVLCAVGGYYLARWWDASIAGAMAVACGLVFTVVNLISPRYGLVTRWIHHRKLGAATSEQLLLLHLQRDGRIVPLDRITLRFSWSRRRLAHVVDRLVRRGWVEAGGGGLRLTAAGASALERSGQLPLRHRGSLAAES